jgi:hypothetical protein
MADRSMEWAVARAIYEANLPPPPAVIWANASYSVRKWCLKQAKAAIGKVEELKKDVPW